jgi:hypothetical protein
MLLINVCHRDKILNTLIIMGYVIYVVCIFFIEDTINLHDLRKQIHIGLKIAT